MARFSVHVPNPGWHAVGHRWPLGTHSMMSPQPGCFPPNSSGLALPKASALLGELSPCSPLSKSLPKRNRLQCWGPSLFLSYVLRTLPFPVDHLGFKLLSTGSVAGPHNISPFLVLHHTDLFLPALLLPEGCLPEMVKDNSKRSLKPGFPLSLCPSRPQEALPNRCQMPGDSSLSRDR